MVRKKWYRKIIKQKPVAAERFIRSLVHDFSFKKRLYWEIRWYS